MAGESKVKKTQAKAKKVVKTATPERKDKAKTPVTAGKKGMAPATQKAGKKTQPKGKKASHAGTAGRKVKFTFNGPAEGEVYLAGVFNDWDVRSIPLHKSDEGTWIAFLELLPGRYEYNFVVDGNWTEDASCSELVPNCFGSRNSVIVIE
jgi:1,4-alpha-glucan branching enzyme